MTQGARQSTARHQASDAPADASATGAAHSSAETGEQHEVEAVERPREEGVEDEEPEDVRGDGDHHAEHGAGRAQLRVVLEVVGGDVEPGARRHDGADDRDVAVAPAEGPLAMRVQDRAERDHEVDPPHAERERDPGHRDERRVERPARTLGPDEHGERGDRAEQALAQRDDHEQPVALDDVVRVPRRAALARLGEVRAGELDQRQHRGAGERERDRRLGEQERDPARLGDQDRLDVGHAGGAARRVLPRGAPPLEDHRHPHHDVPGDHDAVVDPVRPRRSTRTRRPGRARG